TPAPSFTPAPAGGTPRLTPVATPTLTPSPAAEKVKLTPVATPAPSFTPSPLSAKGKGTPSPLRSSKTPNATSGKQTPTLPAYQLESFVGWGGSIGRPQATIRVNRLNAGIFADHGIANLAMGGVFVPCPRSYPLGTTVDLFFIFEEEHRQVKARGRVIWE